MDQDILFARQPIYDNKKSLKGYELLYRGQRDINDLIAGHEITNEVMVNFCTGFAGFNQEELPIYINADAQFLKQAHLFLNPQHIVLEILESVEPTEDVIDALKILKRRGFTLALDDYIFEPRHAPFLPYVSLVKVDVMALGIDKLTDRLAESDISKKTLLAEKVEDAEMFDACNQLGFVLFQGYFLERPSMQKGTKLNASKHGVMQLIANLSRADIEANEVADLISTDPVLVLQLLKIVNCPLYPFNREIVHVKEAVVMLGLGVVKQWGVILSLVSASDQPVELFRTLLVRAKTCELFAKELNRENPQEEFLIGLLSGLDAVLGTPMDAVFSGIPFPDHIKDAIINPDKHKKSILSLVKYYESTALGEVLESSLLGQLGQCYTQSVNWADSLMEYV